jgi:chloramphenicol 3-O-phosphotransferase
VTASIVQFSWLRERRRDWSDQELAEFYRVVDALTQAGISVETERGVTDEGEPWFVFVHPARDEVIAHFARVDSDFVADSGVVSDPVRGHSLADVLDRIVDHYAVLAPRPCSRRSS